MQPSFQKQNVLNQQHYNFSVKPNFQNGTTTTMTHISHGSPFPKPHQMSQIPPHINKIPVSTLNQSRQPQCSTNYYTKNSPTFSSTTTSQSQYPDSVSNNYNTMNTYKFVPHQKIQNSQTTVKKPFFNQNQLEVTQSINFSIQSQPSINCAICQHKYKSKDFDYHLSLHKGNKIHRSVVPSPPHYVHPKVQQINGYFSKNQRKKVENSTIKNQGKPEFLYSFENKCQNGNGRFIIQPVQIQKAPPVTPIQLGPKPVPYVTKPQTVRLVEHSPQLMQNISQIRSMNPSKHASPAHHNMTYVLNNNNCQSFTVPLKNQQQPLTYRPATHLINYQCSRIYSNHQQRSVASSKNKQTILNQQQSKQNSRNFSFLNEVNKPTEIQSMKMGNNFQRSDLFEMAEQEESKIYQYFPDLKQSISQPETTNSNQVCASNNNYLKVESQANVPQKKEQKTVPLDLSHFTESSISTIQQIKKPALEGMSKDQLIQTYHNRNRMNLNNIVGMSDVIARQWINSKNALANWNNQMTKKGRSQTTYGKQRKVTANSIMFSQNDFSQCRQKQQSCFKKTISTNVNLPMIPAQSKQIYRGTQVNEEILRNELNGTSKNVGRSPPKVKLPLNYLAIGDFISRKPLSRR